ncbi:MAG: hypothetical protein ABSA12_14550 [Verrucomicrobiia bacterium]|jgi:hypothetical protein
MGIRTIIAIGLGLIAVTAQAVPPTTNNWTSAESAFWDEGSDWSLRSAPTVTDGYDFITNAASKVVSLDNYDTLDYSDNLTISNLTVAGSVGTNNTLDLDDMNAGAKIPLTILNGLTIGNDGVLQMYNSMLQTLNGTFTSGSVLDLALGTNSSPIVVSNNLALAGTLNVTDGGGFTNASSTYTLFTYVGTLNYSGLVLGSTPSNTICVVSTNTIGQVNLGVTVVLPLPFQITSIGVITNRDVVITWTGPGTGTNFVQAEDGGATGYSTNGFQNISGPIILNGATTTNYIDHGGATNSPSRFYQILNPY